MSWGRARRPKISNKLGVPNLREGSDGDIQVRQTGIGARIFAKIGGRWLSNVLHGSEIDSPDVFIPKAWSIAGVTDGDSTTTVKLPEFITLKNFLSIGFQINLGSSVLHAWAWDTPASGSDINRCEVYFNKTDNSVVISQAGTAAQGKDYRLTIFFK